MTFHLNRRTENLEVEDKILGRNINNMFYLSIYIICSECVMIISFFGFKKELPPAYQYIYLFMYGFLLLFGLCTFAVLLPRRKQVNFSKNERTCLNLYTIGFILVMLLWGVTIALLDQPVYGQIIAFATNYVFCACLLLIKPHIFVMVQAIPLAVLFLMLPFFQKGYGILLGHYINLVALLVPLTISSFRSYLFFHDNASNSLREKDISEKDELTNLYNRRKMNEYIEQEITSKQTSLSSVGILMMDVDYFKKYNDRYGHIQGDSALQIIGNTLKRLSEEYGIFAARYGGEEFIIIIKNKELEQVSRIALEIIHAINNLKIAHEASDISNIITVSMGQHYSPGSQFNIYEMIKKADEVLYEAKCRGRNQIVST